MSNLGEILRTPDERFDDLADWPYEARYGEIDGLRMHYVDEGPPHAAPVLLLHGEPTWSYLYRSLIEPLTAAGCRVVAPDMIGFGRSNKPAEIAAHTYARHVGWMAGFLEALDLRDITLVCQDWGGLLGLRLVAEHPQRFAAVVAANTGLPTGDQPMPKVWWRFHDWVAGAEELPISFLVDAGCVTELSDPVKAAYDAPFPDETYKAGPRAMPQILPTSRDDPAAPANRAAWQQLARWDRPLLCAFSDSDPITAGAEPILRGMIPGAQGQPHVTIARAGHFLQEDNPAALAAAVLQVVPQA